MLAKTLPVLALCACATTNPLPRTDHPGLAQVAQSYAPQLRAVGITRVVSPGAGAPVRLDTGYGPVYVRYPTGVEPLAFVLDIEPDTVRAAAASYNRATDEQILAALVPTAVRVTAGNNDIGWWRANPRR